jgi:hypothetical protein
MLVMIDENGTQINQGNYLANYDNEKQLEQKQEHK